MPSSLLSALPAACWSLRLSARRTPGWLAGYGLLTLVQALLPALQVIMVQALITRLDGGTPGDLAGPLLGVTAVVGLSYPLSQVAMTLAQRMWLRLRFRLQADLLTAVSRLPPGALSDASVGTEIEASRAACEEIDKLSSKVIEVVSMLISALALCGSLFLINPVTAILVGAALLPTVFGHTVIARAETRGWPILARHQHRAGYATEQVIRERTGTELATLGTAGRVAELAAGERRAALRVLDSMIAVGQRMDLLSGLATALLLAGALAALVVGGANTAGAAAAVLGTVAGLAGIRYAGFAIGIIVSAAPKAITYRRLVESVPLVPIQSIDRSAETLSCEAITVGYGDGPAVLHDVSLTARRGEMIALVGINGAGKTTCVNALLGTVGLRSGRVAIDGVDLAGLSITERLGRFGLLTQEFGRYEFTVRDVVGLGRPRPADDHELRAALTDAHADTLVDRLPDGLDTQLGQQWSGPGLSGGQWQRLALARIHLRAAGIWILDEPTSAVDAEAERMIFDELRRTKQERITIVVSHRATTLRGMDRIYVFDDGRIVESGTYPDLITGTGPFSRLFKG
ncbi:ATP-binding cassette domain-containing protein [Microlunatus speluncae]|uniref:ATP-binding cassette domain-containing protein n=1 Tax=Microlunatus speluncae TaxID=2594267 RepID=UPI0012662D04|nr:ABC transporter ATP-binding protein [Microlunatus speluncae]